MGETKILKLLILCIILLYSPIDLAKSCSEEPDGVCEGCTSENDICTMKILQETSRSVVLNNGEKMPAFGLGTYDIQNQEVITYSIVELGYRHIDTAQVYENEELVSKAIKEAIQAGISRDELFITTKLWNSGFENPVKALRESLGRLNLKYVDMYLIHWPIPEFEEDKKTFKKTPMHQVWQGMERCVELGIAKSIGVSNFNVQLLIDMLAYAKIPPTCNQVEVHPYYQQEGLLQFCQKYGIAVVAYAPLSSPARPDGGNGRNILKDPILQQIANSHDTTPAQIALAWNLQLGNVVISKTNNVTRAKENIEAVSVALSSKEMDLIRSLDANEKIYDTQEWECFGNIHAFK
ncbi:unnamed protein product [Moneuplotes crassus]|uniref:NADP-dependent oxidoreductase domain-containing protein n=1 Tax=Euplotes crassus TaxID=5936 RepID=A0AAD2CX36_EUPCR|nr:unnamed protein product [Moneuplotes crassus]